MAKGTVAVVTDKGYGFISTDAPEAAGKEIFFHNNGISQNLRDRGLHVGDKIIFDIEMAEKGPRAINIKLEEEEAEEETSTDSE